MLTAAGRIPNRQYSSIRISNRCASNARMTPPWLTMRIVPVKSADSPATRYMNQSGCTLSTGVGRTMDW